MKGEEFKAYIKKVQNELIKKKDIDVDVDSDILVTEKEVVKGSHGEIEIYKTYRCGCLFDKKNDIIFHYFKYGKPVDIKTVKVKEK